MQWTKRLAQSVEQCLRPLHQGPPRQEAPSPIHLNAPTKPPINSPRLSTESSEYSESIDDSLSRSSYTSSDTSAPSISHNQRSSQRRPTLIQTIVHRPTSSDTDDSECEDEQADTSESVKGGAQVENACISRPVRPDPPKCVRDVPKYAPADSSRQGNDLRSLRWGREISFRAAWQVAPKQRLMQTTALAWETVTSRARRQVKFTNLIQQWSSRYTRIPPPLRLYLSH